MSRNNYNKYYNKNNNKFEKKEKAECNKPEPIEKKLEQVEEDNPSCIGMISGAEKVYMRFGADKNSEPIDILDEGDALEILEYSDQEWYKVCNSAGVEGFVMKRFVTI